MILAKSWRLERERERWRPRRMDQLKGKWAREIILKERIGDDFEHADEPREESKRASWEYLTRYNSTSSGMRQQGGWRGRERGSSKKSCKVGLGPVKQGGGLKGGNGQSRRSHNQAA